MRGKGGEGGEFTDAQVWVNECDFQEQIAAIVPFVY